MFSQKSIYQKLYPNLNLSSLQVRSRSHTPERITGTLGSRQPSSVDSKLSTTEPSPKPEPKPAPKPDPKPEPKPVKRVVIKEDTVEPTAKLSAKEEGVKGEPKVPPKKVIRRPREKLPPPPEPKNPDNLPKKGQKGIRSKYSDEQKREMYLARLSRKAVHRAEKEVEELQQYLESKDHSKDAIDEDIKQTKKRLQLVNRAKFFCLEDNIDATKRNISSTTISETPNRATNESRSDCSDSSQSSDDDS